MSENNDSQTVRVVITKDENQEALQQENKELAMQLEQIATKEFCKQCQQYGINPETSTPEDLQRVKAERRGQPAAAVKGGDGCSWEQNKYGSTFQGDSESLPLELIKADSPETLIQILNKRTDKDAKLALNKMNAKLIKSGKGLNIEFEGSSKDFLKSPLPISDNLEDSERERRERINDKLKRNRTNWKNLKDYEG